MKTRNSVLLMLGILFLVVAVSISLIFLESSFPVLLILTLGLIYVIIIDLILIKKSKTKKVVYKTIKPQTKDNFGDVYNNLLKTSIDLNEKLEKLSKREQQLNRIAGDANKIINSSQNIRRKVRPVIKRKIKRAKPKKRFVASMLSNTFHSTKCKFIKLISKKNRIFFTSKAQALRQGYKPCNELKR